MQRYVRRVAVVSGVMAGIALVSLGGCSLLSDGTPPPIRVGVNLFAEYVVDGALHPSALAFASDGRVFYTEKNTGQIRVIAGGTLLDAPFATVPVNFADDRGLLGIALHPDFVQNGRVYVFYTRSDTGATTDDSRAVLDNRVVYFESSGNVASGGEVFVASLPANLGTQRVSGRLAFAADGKLLVGVGDQTAADSALDRNVLVGKILRYNDDGSIPSDNPIADSPYYARGFRDIQGLTIDPANGTPFVIDHNEAGHDEIDRIVADHNYGWPAVVGTAGTTDELAYVAANPDYVDPIRDTGSDAPGLVGGSFNPSSRYGPNMFQHFFYGESENRRVMRATLDSARTQIESVDAFATRFPSGILDVAFTPAGTLYVACHNAIFRLTLQQ